MSETTTVDELFDELEKDIDLRRMYLHTALEETGMAIVENKLLQRKFNIAIKELTRIRLGGCDTDAAIALDALDRIERLNI